MEHCTRGVGNRPHVQAVGPDGDDVRLEPFGDAPRARVEAPRIGRRAQLVRRRIARVQSGWSVAGGPYAKLPLASETRTWSSDVRAPPLRG